MAIGIVRRSYYILLYLKKETEGRLQLVYQITIRSAWLGGESYLDKKMKVGNEETTRMADITFFDKSPLEATVFFNITNIKNQLC